MNLFYFVFTRQLRRFWHWFWGWGEGGYFSPSLRIITSTIFCKFLFEFVTKGLNFISVQKFVKNYKFLINRKEIAGNWSSRNEKWRFYLSPQNRPKDFFRWRIIMKIRFNDRCWVHLNCVQVSRKYLVMCQRNITKTRKFSRELVPDQ